MFHQKPIANVNSMGKGAEKIRKFNILLSV
ncbi:Uncharacterised protein [Shimwellia blattae]|nr:Uncharacterised protein [Shimwellia blattae]VEC22996.1 Uncharacterised protein [Shimwellia blattae]